MRHRKTREWMQREFGVDFVRAQAIGDYWPQERYPIRMLRGAIRRSIRGNGLPPGMTPEISRLHARVNYRGYVHATGEHARVLSRWVSRRVDRYGMRRVLAVDCIY